MRRSRISVRRSRVAIVPPQLLLNLYRPHRRIHLDLLVEAVVVGLAQVVHKVERPRPAISPRRIQPRIEAQRLPSANFQQGTVRLQSFQFGLILNARQIEPVDLSILEQQGLVRRPEHRIPSQPPEMPAVCVRAAHGKGAARHPPAHHRQEDNRRELKSDELSQGSCVGQALLPAKPPHQFFFGSGLILSHAVKWPNANRRQGHYLCTQSTSGWLLTFHEGRCSTVLSANHGPFLRLRRNPAYVRS